MNSVELALVESLHVMAGFSDEDFAEPRNLPAVRALLHDAADRIAAPAPEGAEPGLREWVEKRALTAVCGNEYRAALVDVLIEIDRRTAGAP